MPPSSQGGDGLDPATWKGLHYLESVAGPGAVAELVEAFTRDAGPRMAQLREAVASGDQGRVRRLAHDLKANAGTLGALLLADLGRRMEEGVEAPEAELILLQAEGELARVTVAVRERLRQLEAC
nr:Hpt domain-containing protein [uncultured Holophaga sp.]